MVFVLPLIRIQKIKLFVMYWSILYTRKVVIN